MYGATIFCNFQCVFFKETLKSVILNLPILITMKQKDFIIDKGMVLFLVIGSLLLTLLGAIAKVEHWYFSQPLLTIGLFLFFSTWIIVFSDVVKNNIYNKTFWIVSLFIMPFIAVLFYVIQRERLLRLGQKFS